VSAENNKKIAAQSITPPHNPSSLRDLLVCLKNTLRFHQLSGITHYPATPELQKFLIQKNPPRKEEKRPDRSATHIPVTIPAHNPSQPPPSSPKKRFAELKKDFLSCSSCSRDHVQHTPIQGLGSPSPLLMIIGDRTFRARNPDGRFIFGPGEDEMLWKMMAAIGLTRAEVYVTNCIKCPVIELNDDGEQAAACCSTHLKKEIFAVSPPLILAMGELTARLLLNSREPLHRLRGTFKPYFLPKLGSIPVLATYHPRFLLVNEKMKQITWVDLQLVQSKLKKNKKDVRR